MGDRSHRADDGAVNPDIVAARVREARTAADHRSSGTRFVLNLLVPGRLLRERWRVPRGSLDLAERALEHGALSVRGFDRVLLTGSVAEGPMAVTATGPRALRRSATPAAAGPEPVGMTRGRRSRGPDDPLPP